MNFMISENSLKFLVFGPEGISNRGCAKSHLKKALCVVMLPFQHSVWLSAIFHFQYLLIGFKILCFGDGWLAQQ